jgi:signal transduction histidine kinase
MLKKAFSDVFTAVAGIMTAVLLMVSAVLCGAALMAFVKIELDALPVSADGEYIYDDDGILQSSRGEFSPLSYIDKEQLEKAPKPSLTTFHGTFSEAVFLSVTKTADGNYRLLVGDPKTFNDYFLNVMIIAVLTDLFGICIIFITIYFLTKRFIAPIEEMTVKVSEFENGDFSARVKVESDSEIGFLAESLNRMATKIEQNEDDRKAFIANVSHELRTPMTTISGFVDGILDGTIEPENCERYLLLVSNETKRLSRLVTNMLFLSSFDSGKMTVKRKEFDILPMFITVLTHFRDEIIRKNITVNAPECSEFMITGDVDLINQVIFNLFENAVKFTKEDGEIDITFTAGEAENSVRIRNSGSGLNPDEITKVFERFYKADASRGKDKYGAGLGLSIVSGIMRLHEGKLVVRSEPEKFTEFDITLPNNVDNG